MATKKSADALQTDLRAFVSAHPEGWGHAEWTGLLDGLRAKGVDVEDEAKIGAAVERERLAKVLGQVKNVGPQRVKALVDRYETVWSLRGADPVELSATTKIPLAVVEQIKLAV